MNYRIIDSARVIDLTSTEPVSPTEAKTHLRITYTDDDTEISSLITRARKQIENWLNISIVYQRILIVADVCESLTLPFGPVIGLESVQVTGSSTGSGVGLWETSSGWQVMIPGDIFIPGDGSISVNITNPYPFSSNVPGRYKITYTAGMSTVPDDLKQAILAQVAYLYEHRGEENLTGLSPEAETITQPYRKLWL